MSSTTAPGDPTSLDRLQAGNGSWCSTGRDFAIFLISRRSGGVHSCGRPPEYFGCSEANQPALPLWITSRPGGIRPGQPRVVLLTSFHTAVPAGRHVPPGC
jgi:hypothetical protein